MLLKWYLLKLLIFAILIGAFWYFCEWTIADLPSTLFNSTRTSPSRIGKWPGIRIRQCMAPSSQDQLWCAHSNRPFFKLYDPPWIILLISFSDHILKERREFWIKIYFCIFLWKIRKLSLLSFKSLHVIIRENTGTYLCLLKAQEHMVHK